MKGFKEFLLRGNLVELAVAFIMATAFAAVVTAFTQIILDLIGLAGGMPDFSNAQIGGVNVGVFLTALIAFLIMATVVYFGLVLPYNKLRERFDKEGDPEADATPTSEELLVEIRDLLKQNRNL
ncbi:large conductance mechanosensitive channel protein MscL [Tessaracoccus rhinocerotis]|uniref:Large conductance mechanosensitive channel protein MscL n=1 Tax=Tessaracoccus rhinocerotis TaxID=1689449 RepID=A0A553K6N4_9ACTN|nr:large conductance mechanosensitive channel protein MscL [Tessaracoccus rhinocerotis]TRY20321.1 large conductance mechanosensitive channel protein MscL [Tessaracoccus rhinocerotis]